MTAQEILDTPDLIAAGVAGDEVRRRMHGTRTTFVRVLEVHVQAPLQALPQGAQPGEIRIVGAPETLDAAVTAVRSAASCAGTVPVTGFALSDLLPLGPLTDVLAKLKEAGLATVAQLPIDLLPDVERMAREVRAAGLGLNAITVQKLDDSSRVAVCERARDLQSAIGEFRAFAPLPRTVSIAKPTTGYDDVKMVALARIVAPNIASIQVDWQLYGPKMAQVALTVGADDIDNVSAVDPGLLGTRRSPVEEIRRNIKSAALDPVERDGLFRRREEMRA